MLLLVRNSLPKELTHDGLHPNDAGYELIEPLPQSAASPLQDQTELQEPWQILLRRAQAAELRVGHVHRRDARIPGMVQRIHRLKAELQPDLFVSPEIF